MRLLVKIEHSWLKYPRIRYRFVLPCNWTMRTYKRSAGSRQYDTSYTQEALRKTLDKCRKGWSLLKASKAFSIPYGTLHNRYHGKHTRITGRWRRRCTTRSVCTNSFFTPLLASFYANDTLRFINGDTKSDEPWTHQQNSHERHPLGSPNRAKTLPKLHRLRCGVKHGEYRNHTSGPVIHKMQSIT